MTKLKGEIDQLKKLLNQTQKQQTVYSGDQKTMASLNQFGTAYADISISRSGGGKFSNSISSHN
jgi:hypothetical protein